MRIEEFPKQGDKIEALYRHIVTYPGNGPPFSRLKTWWGLRSFLNEVIRLRPWQPPLFTLTNTSSGLVFSGIMRGCNIRFRTNEWMVFWLVNWAYCWQILNRTKSYGVFMTHFLIIGMENINWVNGVLRVIVSQYKGLVKVLDRTNNWMVFCHINGHLIGTKISNNVISIVFILFIVGQTY